MATRTYGQFCALARTLDVVGGRWTLLVVRDLLGGPKRYSDLLEGLPGIGTSLLAERLKHLEAEGLIRRRVLPPPAASTVYELTELGDELGRALMPLVAWGAVHLLSRPRLDGEVFRAEWPLLVARVLMDPGRVRGLNAVYEFRVAGSVAHLRVEDGRVSVQPGPAPGEPDVVLTSDLDTFVAVGTGRIDPRQARADGRMRVDGEPDAVRRFLSTVTPVGSGEAARAH
jgi:DNA-binding HxlR family transcriptional regulator